MSLTDNDITERGLVGDYINTWIPTMSEALWFLGLSYPQTEEEILAKLAEHVPLSYEEYFRARHPEDLEDAIRLSNPDRVRELNLLVREYQEDLPRLLREKDFSKLVSYCKRADMLIRGFDFPNKPGYQNGRT